MLDLVHTLVDREDAADGEQHDGDDERVDEPLPAVSEGVLVVAARLARLPPISSSTWFPESASECTDSASIEDEPRKQERDELRDRDPEVRASAARIALVPPDVLIVPSPRAPHGALISAHSPQSLVQTLPGGRCCAVEPPGHPAQSLHTSTPNGLA